MPGTSIEIAAVTPREWPLVVQLLASGSSAGSCWCMWFRLAPKDYDRETAESRRETQRARLMDGRTRALHLDVAGFIWMAGLVNEQGDS